MEKNIKDYAHFYIDCETFTQTANVVKFVGIVYRDGVSWPQVQEFKRGKPIGPAYTLPHWNHLKPILRKLESMTEEEAQEIEHYMWEDNVDFLYDDRAEILKYFLKPWDDDYRPAFPVYVRAINWLRSKGFDCDGLIDSGLAIEKQPTTQNQGV